MKIAFAICTTLIILTVSCKKTNDQINMPPVLTDTIKPPVTKVDTSTLLKLWTLYAYDATGTVITDSSQTKWVYDDQRRIVQRTTDAGSHIDTSAYTYLSDRYLVYWHVFNPGSELISHSVYYQHEKNRTDSIVGTSIGYGIEAGSNTSATYYYYNQAGQDSLEKVFQAGYGSLYTTLNYFYTDANPDSTVLRDNAGKLTDISYYSDGNQTVDKWYTSGAPGGVEHISYSNISTGGLQVIFKNSKLISGTISVIDSAPTNANPGATYTSTYTYIMDASNRVAVMSLYNTSNVLYQKYVFTYY